MSNGFQQFANGQPLVVENRPGAGGTLAAAQVALEKPDGYVLLLAEIGANAAAHALQSKLSYDPERAFTPIIHVANLPTVVLMRPTLPYKTLGDLIAAAKQQPGKFNYASAGIGNWTHLFMAYLNSRAGVEMVNVPYRSGAEMTTSLLRGDTDVAAVTVSTSMPFIKEGKVRAVAGFPAKQIPELADTPPATQSIPGFSIDLWHGIVAPAGMDPALVSRINTIFNKVLEVPAVSAAISQSQAAAVVGGSAKQFDDLLKVEQKRWPELIKSAGIKLD
ncbi:tripartite tricarboxylate transporter substrate-binding protein [Bradyrhizobium sp.]|uniref:Bug family tripartite tricarboxylate transporter substrate binding protein n=1 Tax=Bradyrhizobium sp. TaxID=376 RepID=UPI001D6AF4C3|nr:tripartite tricarboxylate transporter substrate-binding protein [Bradyrhizobium sp.]MBI5319352.1 tripartite tricarboxylate transporter substrate binding protein [Bradyrhizobium sp.]